MSFAGYVEPDTRIPTNEEVRIHKLWGEKYYVSTYDIAGLDKDIAAKVDESGIYQNSIQSSSKEALWKKQKFLEVIRSFKEKNTKNIVTIMSKNSELYDPFLPTCCTAYKSLSFKAMKNGIVKLSAWWQDWLEYELNYLYYKEGYLYEITLATWFLELEDSIDTKYMNLQYCGTEYKWNIDNCPLLKKVSSWVNTWNLFMPTSVYLKSWFNSPKLDSDFYKVYDDFITDMTLVMKK